MEVESLSFINNDVVQKKVIYSFIIRNSLIIFVYKAITNFNH